MRKALRSNPQRMPKSVTQQVPFPVKGWASEESPMEAEEGTALILDNWFPEAESGRLRRGYADHATGMSADINTLLVYTSASASKMFAANGANIYDVSSAGAVGAAAVSGLTSDKWQDTMFATTGGQYMVIANGSDSVRNYDGSSWSTPAITNVTSSTLIHVAVHKSRLWFVQSGTADLWYLPTLNVAGAATKFPLGGLLDKGGYIMACGTWSVDAGSGMDDLFWAWSSEGQIIIYQGTDPASSWALVGVYDIGKPIGRRCTFAVGGDVALMSDDGILPISTVMKTDRAVISEKAMTKRIRQAWVDSTLRGRSTFGWQIISHPVRNMAIVNIPATGSYPVYQYVMNTITGAWCRFYGMNALCWAHFNNEIYFGAGDGTVYKADTGGTDDGGAITGVILPAYMHLSARGRLKHVKMAQALYTTDVVAPSPRVEIAVDYELPVDIASGTVASGDFFTWDVSQWDGPDIWFGYTVQSDWSGSGNIGTVISLYTTLVLDATEADPNYKYRLTGWGIIYEVGGVL